MSSRPTLRSGTPSGRHSLSSASSRLSSVLAALALAGMFAVSNPVRARDLSSITRADATAGVKAALEKGSAAAVASLGAEDGFLGNPKVKIPLPDGLQQAEKVMRLMGRQQQFDDLVVSINRAAESAIPLARPLIVSAIRSMSVADAKAIIAGGDDSVTRFFRSQTEKDLTTRFLPIVKRTTDKARLAQQYNRLAGQAASFGAINEADARIESYVTGKALDGLFLMIAQEERAIRQDPLGTGSAILRKVFGAN